MTIKEVVSLLQKEQQYNLPSRFHCRAIMVKNIAQYCDLLSELKKIANVRVVKTDEIFSGADVMPAYQNLEAERYQNEWIILTGVSEYLRLFSKNEVSDQRFGALWNFKSPSSSTGRIIIPLWGCGMQWFDSALNLNGDLRQEDYYYDCTDNNFSEPILDLLVLSRKFEQYTSQIEAEKGNLIIGLRDWFEYWENPSRMNTQFVLLTKQSKEITPTNGTISIRVMNDIMFKGALRGGNGDLP